MGYVAIHIPMNDLMNGVFVKAGGSHPVGEVLFHLLEEDYRAGVFVKGMRVYGEIIPFTWTDGSTDYRASSFPNREDGNLVDVEQYGGTKEQFEHHRNLHFEWCKAAGREQSVFVHMPGAPQPDFS